MDLIEALYRLTARRPRVLLAGLPGATRLRLVAERELALRHWPIAALPSDADVLLIVGTEPPGMEHALHQAWQAMPPPRVWAKVERAEQLATALDGAFRRLAESGAREAGPSARTNGGPAPAEHERHGAAHPAPDGRAGDRDHDMDDHDMGDMAMPAGLPMAERGDDRDGLRLDQWCLPLGPLLANWPSGLVLRLTLQGDVVQQVQVQTVTADDPEEGSWWDQPWRQAARGAPVRQGDAARRRIAAHLDSLGRLLAVAGWLAPAADARRLRDWTLIGMPTAQLQRPLCRFARRVERSRSLYAMSSRLGRLTDARATEAGVGGPAGRVHWDVHSRYRRWLSEIVGDLPLLDDPAPLDLAAGGPLAEGPRGAVDGPNAPSTAVLTLLPDLLNGTELGAARLIVASLDPDVDQLPRPIGTGHG